MRRSTMWTTRVLVNYSFDSYLSCLLVLVSRFHISPLGLSSSQSVMIVSIFFNRHGLHPSSASMHLLFSVKVIERKKEKLKRGASSGLLHDPCPCPNMVNCLVPGNYCYPPPRPNEKKVSGMRMERMLASPSCIGSLLLSRRLCDKAHSAVGKLAGGSGQQSSACAASRVNNR